MTPPPTSHRRPRSAWLRRLAWASPIAFVAFAAATTRGAPDPGPPAPAAAPCKKGEAPTVDTKTGRPSCLAAPTCTTPANRIRACGQWESPVVDPQTGCPTCVAAAAPSAC
ncbi:MAG: hypothetical protein JNL38_09120, partial [Myxococcales bacterium]|nr:hypothetical protein [Myxococcales bacterium]